MRPLEGKLKSNNNQPQKTEQTSKAHIQKPKPENKEPIQSSLAQKSRPPRLFPPSTQTLESRLFSASTQALKHQALRFQALQHEGVEGNMVCNVSREEVSSHDGVLIIRWP
ncbi:hypothetical protein M758_10G080100 [Ceratodon purpureus]|uniref:Uncharacterized protein n=1 Tax=Ceratodon purpureus TaxID=3225 RepID=A0A8T0GLP4_CERPU|nr:hypothetical protein KC19_10G081400 [Ceratodon purpureus]KAG0603262.1 hypothetical protein M758_10G080100 [Ceratodon purpureus]